MKRPMPAFAAAMFAATALATSVSASETPPATTAPAIVAEVGNAWWQFVLDESPVTRLDNGLPVEKLPDVSDAHTKESAGRVRALLARLDQADTAKLSGEDLLSSLVLRDRMTRAVEEAGYARFSIPITPYASPIRNVQRVFSEFPIRSAADADRYLALLDQYPRFIGGIRRKLEDGAAAGIVLPKPEIAAAVPYVASGIRDGKESPFFVAPDRLKSLPEEKVAAFQAALLARVSEKINPALRELADYVQGPYAAKAKDAVGVSQYPGGADYYRFLIRLHTGLSLTPEEIHKTGLAELNRINRELDGLRVKTGFAGDLVAFRKFLKTDKRFYPATPEEIGNRLMTAVRRIEPKIGTQFGTLPKAPYGVRRLQAELEGAMTFGYYQQPTPALPEGDYYYNGSRLSERSLLNAAALIYHELVPGHHFQINLQMEYANLPDFRRLSFGETAFTEGWGEYASALAGEMGMYADPYDACGRLAMDAFVSTRLVVDTGMNALGWSRERAIAYMKENTFEGDLQIGTETLRYSTDIPGQALAYKLGSLEIRRLREKAKAALGPRFDPRRFHDAVLGSGTLPLSVLGRKIDDFIAMEKGR
jgi:uncharacterized protein (DUF885 family)